MSQMLTPEDGDIFGMLIDDSSVFNLQILQRGLGLTEESTKKWCSRNKIRSVSQGRTWLFTGRLFRQDLENNAGGANATG